MKMGLCQLSASATAAFIDRKTVGVTAYLTFVCDQLRATAASCTFVCHDYRILLAFGAEPALNGIEVSVFLFEIIDIDSHRAYENNE